MTKMESVLKMMKCSIGAVFMINWKLVDILENLDEKQVYDYVICNDEIIYMIEDMLDMEYYWHDVMIMLDECHKRSFFEGQMISSRINQNGCIALIKSTELVKDAFEDMSAVSKTDMEAAYLKQKDIMVDSFENDWKFFNELKNFYAKVFRFNRKILLFCGGEKENG